MERLLEHRLFPYLAGAISCLLLAPAITAGLQMDDWFQHYRLLGFAEPSINLFVFYDGDVAGNRLKIESGQLPWWASEHLRHANFRYLSTLSMQLDHLLWPHSPAMMHLHSLVWLAAVVMSIAWLYRATITPLWVAGLAALLYALDDAHALPTVYLANRNALLATCFGALSLLLQVKGRNAWSAMLLALSLASAEIGLGTLAYLGAYALCLDKGKLSQRALRLWPQTLVFVIWALIYRVGGFGSAGSGYYLDPMGNPLEFLSALGERLAALAIGQWTPLPADLVYTLDVSAFWVGSAIALVTSFLVFFLPLLRRNALARYWLLGSFLALLPVSATGPQNRLLFFVGIGAMAFLAIWLRALAVRDEQLPAQPVWRLGAYVLALFMLLTHLLLAPVTGYLFLQFQDQASNKMIEALESAPHDENIASQDLVIINPPDYVYLVSAIKPFKALQGRPVAKKVRALATGSSQITIDRLGPATLQLTLAQGLFPTPFSRYYRGPSESFRAGQALGVQGMAMEIVALNAVGDPAIIRFHFEQPLESASLRFLRYRDGQYEEWRPPALGQSVTIPGEPGIFDG
jgi:hypothetical protein